MNFVGKFPARRPRRMRRDEFSRRLMRESALCSADFIYPVFVLDGSNREEQVASLPGVSRKSVDLLFRDAETCVELGIPAMALFPVIDDSHKSLDAKAAWDAKGLVPSAIRALKARFPALGIMADVALDPYTSHGQDGLVDATGYVANDPTVVALTRQALCQAEAGVDILAPSDMTDGRVGALRSAPGQRHLWRAHGGVSGQRRVRDAQGRGGQRVAGRAGLRPGSAHRVQAGRRGCDSHLLCDRCRTLAQGRALVPSSDRNSAGDSRASSRRGRLRRCSGVRIDSRIPQLSLSSRNSTRDNASVVAA